MAKLIASVLCLFVLVEVAAAAGGSKPVGGDCANDDECSSSLLCSNSKCKSKQTYAGTPCDNPNVVYCDPDTLTCESGKCMVKNGVACTPAAPNCIANADCTADSGSSKCACKTGFPANTEGTKCGGAMGIAASVLLVVATFVTSRFL